MLGIRADDVDLTDEELQILKDATMLEGRRRRALRGKADLVIRSEREREFYCGGVSADSLVEKARRRRRRTYTASEIVRAQLRLPPDGHSVYKNHRHAYSIRDLARQELY